MVKIITTSLQIHSRVRYITENSYDKRYGGLFYKYTNPARVTEILL